MVPLTPHLHHHHHQQQHLVEQQQPTAATTNLISVQPPPPPPSHHIEDLQYRTETDSDTGGVSSSNEQQSVVSNSNSVTPVYLPIQPANAATVNGATTYMTLTPATMLPPGTVMPWTTVEPPPTAQQHHQVPVGAAQQFQIKVAPSQFAKPAHQLN